MILFPYIKRGRDAELVLLYALLFGSLMAKIDVVCPRGSEAQGMIRNGHSSSGTQLYRYNGAKPEPHQTIIDMAMNGSGCRDTARLLKISLNTVLRHLKTCPASGSAKR